MYGWFFRLLPGPRWLRVIIMLALAVAVVAVLFTWVFPAIAPYMPFNDGLIGAARLGGVGAGAAGLGGAGA